MNWIKQNWIKVGTGILILSALLFGIKGLNNNSPENALVSDSILSATPTPTVISEDEQKIIELKKTLPRFEDYPAKVYSIPPKPKLDHKSSLYGMRYWTLTENWINEATSYDMGGHYLMGGYGTGNPDTIIIDGLTGKVSHDYGAPYYSDSLENSFLVVFNPIDEDCFSLEGDYNPCYGRESAGDSPRYAIWNGEKFVIICEPVIKAWKLISCGKYNK